MQYSTIGGSYSVAEGMNPFLSLYRVDNNPFFYGL